MPATIKPIRWTRERAGMEFRIDSRALSKNLRKAEIEPGKDDCFTTLQICAAVFGDIASERLRLVKEQADKLALENAEKRRDLISVSELSPVINRAIAAIKARISSASNLDREDKDKLLHELGR